MYDDDTQIVVRTAQMEPLSTSLVGHSLEWAWSDVSLVRYGPPKILPHGGEIYARIFIRMVHNLPLILEGIGTSTPWFHRNGSAGVQSPFLYLLFFIYLLIPFVAASQILNAERD